MKTLKALIKDWLQSGKTPDRESKAETTSEPTEETLNDKTEQSDKTEAEVPEQEPEVKPDKTTEDSPGEEPEDKSDKTEEEYAGQMPETNPESEFKPDSLTQNQKQNETETDESARNPELDNPSAGESDGADQELQTGTRGTGSEGLSDFEAGRIAGRNEQIEEKYFPATDDGIPQFRGRTTTRQTYTDIFSMAREA